MKTAILASLIASAAGLTAAPALTPAPAFAAFAHVWLIELVAQVLG